MNSNSYLHFPPGFLWGAATSAYQIEGAHDQDGKGPSIWDTFCLQPGKIYGGQTGEIAADHYHRWAEDVGLMADLGLNAYRFSIAWSRVLPNGQGQPNSAGLAFYDRLVDALLERGIQPYITLYHFDLPQALQERGGWINRDTAQYFSDYARLVAAHLGDRVHNWITHNEPEVVSFVGHFLGEHAPGVQDPLQALQAAYNLLLSHGLAVEALRSSLPGDSQVGITLNLNPIHPATPSKADVQAAQRTDLVLNRLFLEPVLRGQFPPEIQTVFGPLFPTASPEDLAAIGARLDFIGVNYYARTVIRYDPDYPIIQASQVQPPGNEYSQMWEIYPQGMYETLTRVWNEYARLHPSPPYLLITENGIPVADGPDLDGRVRDSRRIQYLYDHLRQVHRAVQEGVPVQGYFVWTLMDNFEWAHGYRMRFGLAYVDYDTLERSLKDSGRWFAEVIRRNALPAP